MKHKLVLLLMVLISTYSLLGGERERVYADEIKYEYASNYYYTIPSYYYTDAYNTCTEGTMYSLDIPDILKHSGYTIIDSNREIDGVRSLRVSKDGKHYLYNGRLQHRYKGSRLVHSSRTYFDNEYVSVYNTSDMFITKIFGYKKIDCNIINENIEGFYIPLKPYYKNPKLSSSGEYKLTVNGEALPTTFKEFNLPVGSVIEVKLHNTKVFKGTVRLKSDGYTKELVKDDLDLSGTGLIVNAQTSSAITFNRNSIVFNKERNNLLKSRGVSITKSFNMR